MSTAIRKRPVGTRFAALVVGILATVTACTATGPLPVPTEPSAACESLTALEKIPDVTLTAAETVAAGDYQPTGSTVAFADLPEFCRVTARVTVTTGSSTSLELWLPTTEWNGRYLQVGTNGFGGVFSWDKMAPQLRRGFVTATGDSGHVSPGGFNPTWAFESPERFADYAGRSMHEVAVASKAIIEEFYGQPANYSYHVGASTGGRWGFVSAQRYPEDFDGILTGTAIQYFTRGATQMLVTSQALTSAGISGPAGTALLGVVRNAVTAACDDLDGLVDGILTDPRDCDFDPHSIVCAAGQDPATCLTVEQADALVVAFSPLVDPESGETLFVGQTVTSQLDWGLFILNPLYSTSVYKIGLANPAWTASSFDLSADLAVIEESLGVANATDPDLTAFEAAGGKIIQYQGWEDGVTLSAANVQYYESVLEQTSDDDLQHLQGFYRLFMMPGVSHTGQGPGPWNIGQETQTAVSDDAEHDAITALIEWVENGVAPDRFIASKFEADDPTKAIVLQRPVCPYPARAVYDGSGDPAEATSFRCE